MATVASSARSVNDVHYALLRHPLRSPRPHDVTCDVILLVVGTLHMTSRFSLLAPYPTERLDVILHKKLLSLKCVFWFSVQLLSEIFHILRRNGRDMVKNVYRSACTVPFNLICILAPSKGYANYFTFSKYSGPTNALVYNKTLI
jgi:hypothetical protein